MIILILMFKERENLASAILESLNAACGSWGITCIRYQVMSDMWYGASDNNSHQYMVLCADSRHETSDSGAGSNADGGVDLQFVTFCHILLYFDIFCHILSYFVTYCYIFTNIMTYCTISCNIVMATLFKILLQLIWLTILSYLIEFWWEKRLIQFLTFFFRFINKIVYISNMFW